MNNLEQTQFITVIALVIFAAMMIAIGAYSARKTKQWTAFCLAAGR